MRGRFWIAFHYAFMGVWALLVIPTLLWWNSSLLWVAFMSIYANLATHWSAAEAAKADTHQRKRDSGVDQRPSVGRIVHYVPRSRSVCMAAIITAVTDDDRLVDLCVFKPDALYFKRACPRAEGAGSWHWPTRTEV